MMCDDNVVFYTGAFLHPNKLYSLKVTMGEEDPAKAAPPEFKMFENSSFRNHMGLWHFLSHSYVLHPLGQWVIKGLRIWGNFKRVFSML
jgi:hypothetical protein